VGPEQCLPDGCYGIAENQDTLQQTPGQDIYIIQPDGHWERFTEFEPGSPVVMPELTDWEISDAAPELEKSPTGFSQILSPEVDFDALGTYEGSGWYLYEFDGP